MNDKPIYQSSSWGFKVAVYQNRVETKFLGQTKVILLKNIASVTKDPLAVQVNLVLNSGETVAVNPKDTKEFIEAVNSLLAA